MHSNGIVAFHEARSVAVTSIELAELFVGGTRFDGWSGDPVPVHVKNGWECLCR
jgi:hypothetical protein